MIKILFICHGNICRSPMAEFLFRHMAEEQGVGELFSVASAATSREEIGNPVHPGTRKKLAELGISTKGKTARQMTRRDYEEYDYLIYMEEYNLRNMTRITGGDPRGKMFRILDFANEPRDVADPWYTGDFEATFRDLKEGCQCLIDHFAKEAARR